MKTLKFALASFFTLLISTTFSQVNPPAMALPTPANSALIDSIIKVTNHEQFFIDYCTKKVQEYAAINLWEQSNTNKILKGIKFKYYDGTIFNSYADYSTNELKSLLDVLRLMSKKSSNWTRMILTNSMMQNNLDVFVKSLIGGKYVMPGD